MACTNMNLTCCILHILWKDFYVFENNSGVKDLTIQCLYVKSVSEYKSFYLNPGGATCLDRPTANVSNPRGASVLLYTNTIAIDINFISNFSKIYSSILVRRINNESKTTTRV